MPIVAEQHNVLVPAARLFYFDGSMAGVPLQGYHRYVDGSASMLVRLAALIPVARASGDEMTRSETVTLFNDMCVLAPATLLSPAIAWEPVDAQRARARFTNGGHTIGADLSFGAGGELVDFQSDDRSRAAPDGRLERRALVHAARRLPPVRAGPAGVDRRRPLARAGRRLRLHRADDRRRAVQRAALTRAVGAHGRGRRGHSALCSRVNATDRCVSIDSTGSTAVPAAIAPVPRVRATRPATVRAGGRSARIVARVLESTLEVLGRDGYVGLRIEDVASRAGVNKTTIYRRWPSRAELVVAALTQLAGPPHAPEIGRLEPDLHALFMSATTLLATPAGRGIASVLIAGRGDPEVDRVCSELREMHRTPARRLLEHARRRGELPRGTDVDLLLDVLTGAIYGRLRECPGPLDPDWVRRVIRLVLSGVGAPSRPRSVSRQ